MSRKTGRKNAAVFVTEDDVLQVYTAFLAVEQNKVSAKEAADSLTQQYKISVPLVYKIFSNIRVMKSLIDNGVDENILLEVDKTLQTYHIVKLAQSKIQC